MSQVESDLDLLQRFHSAGDGGAFARLVQRYSGLVYSAGYRVMGNRQDAEDLAQDTFLRLMENPTSVDRSLPGWLHRTVTRLAIDRLRQQRARDRREHNRPPLSPETWHELSPRIDEALDAMPEDQRGLLVEHFFNGRRQQDLAFEQGVSTATMSRRMAAAMASLREKLADQGVSLPAVALLALMDQRVVEQVPASLARELGKMAMYQDHPVPPLRWHAHPWTLTAAGTVGALIIAVIAWSTLNGEPRPPTEGFSARAAHPGQERWIRLPQNPGTDPTETRALWAVEMPAAGRATVMAAFGDGHIESLTADDADKLVRKQTGRSLEEWARQHQ